MQQERKKVRALEDAYSREGDTPNPSALAVLGEYKDLLEKQITEYNARAFNMNEKATHTPLPLIPSVSAAERMNQNLLWRDSNLQKMIRKRRRRSRKKIR